MALGLTYITDTTIAADLAPTTDDTIVWASTAHTPINLGAGEWMQVANIQIAVTAPASATSDCIVHARKSTDDGTTDDTEGTYLCTIPVVASGTTVKTVSVYDFNYLDIGAESDEATTYELSLAIQYDGYKITGMS